MEWGTIVVFVSFMIWVGCSWNRYEVTQRSSSNTGWKPMCDKKSKATKPLSSSECAVFSWFRRDEYYSAAYKERVGGTTLPTEA